MNKKEKQMAKSRAMWESVSWEEVATFIGPNAEGYRSTWEKSRKQVAETGYSKFSLGWSWPAMIPMFGIPWAASRKLWIIVGSLVALIIALTIIVSFTKSSSFVAFPFLIAMSAKSFYIQMAVAKIKKIKDTNGLVDFKSAIQDAGGLNMKYGYIACAVSFAFIALGVIGSSV